MKVKFIAMALLATTLLGSCVQTSDDDNRSGGCPFIGANLFIATSDFTSGAAAVLSGLATCEPNTAISSDPAVRVVGSIVYVINRFGFDNIQVLDALNGYTTAAQYSVGNGSNPQDIVLPSATKAFVSRLQNSKIWVGNPNTGVMETEITLAAYLDDPDGVPEAAKMVIIDNRLFVALQRLDETNFFAPTSKSSIAVINTDTNAVVTVIDLVTLNPVTRLEYVPALNKIFVGGTGQYQFINPLPDGGVESISVNTATDTYTADGLVIDEATLGGDISALSVVSNTQAYALVSDAAFNNILKRFNPSTGAVTATLYTTSSFTPDMTVGTGNRLYLADRSLTDPGVLVWDTTTDTQVGGLIDTGLPPYSFAVMQ